MLSAEISTSPVSGNSLKRKQKGATSINNIDESTHFKTTVYEKRTRNECASTATSTKTLGAKSRRA